ncbi:UNVERIFIED_CONTAM: hypothetical protein RMT77_006610 [Armadillidium vulgare]
MVKAKVWVTAKEFSGSLKLDEFKCIEEDLPPCQDGDIIIEAEYLSVDPFQRFVIRATNAPVNSCPPASQVAKVIKSKNPDYPEGCYILGNAGWRSHTHLTKEKVEEINPQRPIPYMRVPDLGSLSRSITLGALGMPGLTAYYGLLDICQPKKGETVLVNSAGGAVGSLVCQIAKIKGCTVIAFAGSEEKISWLKNELHLDHVFNYKTTNISEKIKECAPRGIDCYFENVGGKFSTEVIPHMASNGRIAICGVISRYSDDDIYQIDFSSAKSPLVDAFILRKNLKIEGFHAFKWYIRWWNDTSTGGFHQMKQWIQEGKIKYRETTTKGFENMPRALLGIFKGENIGKAIVEV